MRKADFDQIASFFDKARPLSGQIVELWLGLISRCSCSHGCPSCVGPTKEVGMNSKEVAMAMLTQVLDSTRG